MTMVMIVTVIKAMRMTMDLTTSAEFVCFLFFVCSSRTTDILRKDQKQIRQSEKDVDECRTQTDQCNPSSTFCKNTYGGYRCECKAGYRPSNASQFSCQDIDECKTSDHMCLSPSTRCVNTIGGYYCKCNKGFYNRTKDPDICDDYDECKYMNPCDAKTTSGCFNTIGSYYCQCKEHYTAMRTQVNACQDVNECLTGNGCDEMTTVCINMIGDYSCRCLQGFEPFTELECKDIDECQTNRSKCDPMTTYCENVPGSYLCQCKTGFTNVDEAGLSCEDLNECSTVDNICDRLSTTCGNTYGGFVCLCRTGFYNKSGTFHTCQDVNECEASDEVCELSSARCINTAGSFMCRCRTGYHEIQDGKSCADINECQGSIIFCDNVMSTCQNIPGSYTCICNLGYQAVDNDSVECEDVDECTTAGLRQCDLGISTCVNTPGSFYCSCRNGVESNGTNCVRRQDASEEDRMNYVTIGAILSFVVILQAVGACLYWFVIRKKARAREENILRAAEKEELKRLIKVEDSGKRNKETLSREEIRARRAERRRQEKLKSLQYGRGDAGHLLEADKRMLEKESQAIDGLLDDIGETRKTFERENISKNAYEFSGRRQRKDESSKIVDPHSKPDHWTEPVEGHSFVGGSASPRRASPRSRSDVSRFQTARYPRKFLKARRSTSVKTFDDAPSTVHPDKSSSHDFIRSRPPRALPRTARSAASMDSSVLRRVETEVSSVRAWQSVSNHSDSARSGISRVTEV